MRYICHLSVLRVSASNVYSPPPCPVVYATKCTYLRKYRVERGLVVDTRIQRMQVDTLHSYSMLRFCSPLLPLRISFVAVESLFRERPRTLLSHLGRLPAAAEEGQQATRACRLRPQSAQSTLPWPNRLGTKRYEKRQETRQNGGPTRRYHTVRFIVVTQATQQGAGA